MRYEVLLVDDDLLVRKVVAEEIEEAGHIVMTASNGAAALEILSHRDRSFDLVLFDYSMPDMTGIEAIRLIRKNLPDLKVNFALFSAYDEIPGGQDPSEPWPLVAKATRSAELVKAVEAAARGEPMHLADDAKLSRVDRMLAHADLEHIDENIDDPIR
jgi:CheY-like chemotaxis protein